MQQLEVDYEQVLTCTVTIMQSTNYEQSYKGFHYMRNILLSYAHNSLKHSYLEFYLDLLDFKHLFMWFYPFILFKGPTCTIHSSQRN